VALVMSVRVVTDSTSDLTPEEAAGLGVTVVPLTVHFGERSYLDRVEITPQEFFRRLTSEGVLPKTSQPSVGAFLETYQRLLREGTTAIVSIHISGKLSGTVNAARTARENLPDPSCVVVVDSETVTAPLAYGVRAAAAAAHGGAGPEAVAAAARDAIRRTHLVAVLDTLEYLHKGGRIGRVRAWLGGVLSIKPLISVKDGEVVPVERVRTRTRALERIIELTAQHRDPVEITLLHSCSDEEAARVQQRIAAALPGVPIRTGWIGPVVGVYAGPNVVGTATLCKDSTSV
jgi:DegV family protein with EDD domain